MSKSLEQRIEELEKRVAELEGRVPEQLNVDKIEEILLNQLRTSLLKF